MTLDTPGRTGVDAPLIRAAVPSDLSAAEQLLIESNLPLDGVRDAFSTFVVAESDDALVGVAGLEVCSEHALLRSVAVAPAWRSRGLGRTLVTRIINDAEARAIAVLYLLTTTADQYFSSFGFARITRDEVPSDVQATSEFQGACPTSATVMRRLSRSGTERPDQSSLPATC